MLTDTHDRDRPAGAIPLTAQALNALARAGCAVSTTDVLMLLNTGRSDKLIVDQVYCALAALRARGAVRRFRSASNKRLRYWAIVGDAADPIGTTCACQRTGAS
jgi:hypothetical protein